MGTKWDLDVWQGEKGKSSPTVKVSCTAGLTIETQWAEGWLKTVLHISHSMFETWNLNCSYLQIPTSLKHVATRVMVFLQQEGPWAELPKHLSQNKTEALQFVQHSANTFNCKGDFHWDLHMFNTSFRSFECIAPLCTHIHMKSHSQCKAGSLLGLHFPGLSEKLL